MPIRRIINFKDALDLVIGVNVNLLDDDKQQISYCILRRTGDVVSLFEKRDNISTVDELLSHIGSFIEKGVRVHVNCAGRSVLTRYIEGKQSDVSKYWSEWFPGIAKENFIFQSFANTGFAALSLLRTEEAKKANLFINNSITSFSLGVCIVEAIAPLIEQDSIVVWGHRVTFNSQQLSSIESFAEQPTAEYKVGNDHVPASCIVAYASAISFLLPIHDLSLEGLPGEIDDAGSRYEANRKLHQVGKLVMIVLLSLLPINLAIYFWLDNSVSQMEATRRFRQGSKSTMEQSAMSTQRLNSLYDALGYSANKIPLYYADQLAKAMPAEIQLNLLQAGLPDEKIFRNERRLQFDVLQIRVQGTSKDPAMLNSWMVRLAGLSWIEKVHDQKYQFDPHSGKGMFEFIIMVKPDDGKADL